MNVETVRVVPRNGRWEAVQEPRTVIHGDDICRPIEPGPPEPSPDDTLAIELLAITHLVRTQSSGGRIPALEARFAAAGHAPPGLTSTLRPVARQRALESAIRSTIPNALSDTLGVRASPPRFSGSTATIWVTVGYRGRASTATERARRSFYQTVEYELRYQSGRWLITRNTTHGIS